MSASYLVWQEKLARHFLLIFGSLKQFTITISMTKLVRNLFISLSLHVVKTSSIRELQIFQIMNSLYIAVQLRYFFTSTLVKPNSVFFASIKPVLQSLGYVPSLFLNLFSYQLLGLFNDQLESLEFPEDLVTFTEELLNEKLHFLCSVSLISLIFSLNLQTC